MKKTNLIIVLAMVYIIFRLIVLFYSPYVFYPEEYKTGSLGHDLVFNKNLRMPFFGYLDSPHAGGSIVAQIEVIPFYLVFGDLYLSIKAAALLNSTILLVIPLLLLRKYFLNIELIILTILYSFSLPHFIQASLIIQGNNILFVSFLVLSLVYISKIFLDNENSFQNYIVLGLILGIGLWIHYGASTMLLFTALLHLYYNRLDWWKIGSMSVSIFVGFLPWIIYNIKYGFPSLLSDFVLYQNSFSLIDFPYRIIKFLFVNFPRSFHFAEFVPFIPGFFDYIFLILVLFSVVLIFKQKNKFLKILLSYLVFTILVFNFLSMPIGNGLPVFGSMNMNHEYYVVFLHPFLFMIMSITYSNLLETNRKFGYMILFLVILVSIFSVLTVLNDVSFNKFLFSSAHSTDALAFESGFNYVLNKNTFKKFYDEIKQDEMLKEKYIEGAGVGITYLLETKKIGENEIDNLAEILSILNYDEKKILFIGFIKGDSILNDPPEVIIRPQETSTQFFGSLLNQEDKKVFNILLLEYKNENTNDPSA